MIIISCGKNKLECRAQALMLYTGGTYLAWLRIAKLIDSDIHIISPARGLLGSDDIIQPYDYVTPEKLLRETKFQREFFLHNQIRESDVFFVGRGVHFDFLDCTYPEVNFTKVLSSCLQGELMRVSAMATNFNNSLPLIKSWFQAADTLRVATYLIGSKEFIGVFNLNDGRWQYNYDIAPFQLLKQMSGKTKEQLLKSTPHTLFAKLQKSSEPMDIDFSHRDYLEKTQPVLHGILSSI